MWLASKQVHNKLSSIQNSSMNRRFWATHRPIFAVTTRPPAIGPSTSRTNEKLRQILLKTVRMYAGSSESSSSGHPEGGDPQKPTGQQHTYGSQIWDYHKASYRPGSDTYAYGNPWPKLNKGRLDWMFQDGWRRPLAPDQGAKLRREWIPYGFDPLNEHKDWFSWHKFCFCALTICFSWFTCLLVYGTPDYTLGERDWAYREAFMELERRQAQGLPLISKDYMDPEKVAPTLPSDEELGDMPIII